MGPGRSGPRFAGARDLRVERVDTSLLGTHVRGRQYRGGVPVEGTDWLVSAIAGRIVQAEGHPTSLPGAPAPKPVGAALATASRPARLGVDAARRTAGGVAGARAAPGRLVDTYLVGVLARVPARALHRGGRRR